MIGKIDPKVFAQVCGGLMASDAKSAMRFIDEKTIVRATWRFKPTSRASRREMIVTFGAPNYLERDVIKRCKKAQEPLPGKVQLRAYPKKAKK
jgi:hypothetical protein